jgi:hypothetical protein
VRAAVEADAVDPPAIPAVTAAAVFKKVRLEDICFLRGIMSMLARLLVKSCISAKAKVVALDDQKFVIGHLNGRRLPTILRLPNLLDGGID